MGRNILTRESMFRIFEAVKPLRGVGIEVGIIGSVCLTK